MKPSEAHSALVTGVLLLAFFFAPPLLWAASPEVRASQSAQISPPSPEDEIVTKFLRDCGGKAPKNTNCDKLRSDFVGILKEDLLTLGSTADRQYLPDIVRILRKREVELRIAAADAIGMIGPQNTDVEMLIPATNDPVPDVRQAVSQMIGRGKGTAVALLKQRSMPMRTGSTPEKPADTTKLNLPFAPNSTYLFDSSDASVGRLSYVTKNMNEVTAFYKGKAKKGPFPLQEFKDKYRYQFQDEDEAMRQAQQAEGEKIENTQPPDPTNVQAYAEFMQKIVSVGARQGSRIYLDSYEPNLFGSPTVYVLEERQIGQRSYPTRYVVLYQEQALKRPGYRLNWMTVPDDTIKTAQAASLAEEKEELARNKENEALKKRAEALESLTKKKDEAEKNKFKKGQADLEKELGF
ncbi:MAG: HEAT repeat domain-containing protein [Nitrospirales bacterium]